MNKYLQKLEEKAKSCNRKAHREKLQTKLDRCSEVYESINDIEMELIWYIRQSDHYKAYSYLLVAKKNYEAQLTFEQLIATKNTNLKD